MFIFYRFYFSSFCFCQNLIQEMFLITYKVIFWLSLLGSSRFSTMKFLSFPEYKSKASSSSKEKTKNKNRSKLGSLLLQVNFRPFLHHSINLTYALERNHNRSGICLDFLPWEPLSCAVSPRARLELWCQTFWEGYRLRMNGNEACSSPVQSDVSVIMV